MTVAKVAFCAVAIGWGLVPMYHVFRVSRPPAGSVKVAPVSSTTRRWL